VKWGRGQVWKWRKSWRVCASRN